MIQSIVARARLVLTAAVLLSLVGLTAWYRMPRREDPAMSDYWGKIVAPFPGAGAETVERLLLEPIEEYLAEVNEIQTIEARVLNELCLVDLELSPATKNFDLAWDRVEDALARATKQFPEGVPDPTLNRNLNEQESVVLSLSGSPDPVVLARAAKRIKNQLLDLPEVAKVKLIADPGEQVTIEYDDALAQKLGLDPRRMAAHLSARNRIIPGGSIKMANHSVNLSPHSDFTSIEEIENTPVILPSGAALPLSEVAWVRLGPIEPEGAFMRVGGEPAVGLGIIARDDVNLIDFGNAIRTRVAALQQELLPLKLETLIFQPDRVQKRLNELGSSLFLGILVVAVVLLIFMGFRLGLVVASVLPLVALSSLAIYAAGGGVLQQISISALVIALGMLVDNAIVMAENIQWRMDRGEQPAAAATAAIREMALPLGSATGTTLAAFVPMLMAEGTTADFTRALPVVIIMTLTVSYLFAVFVTPTLSRLFLRKRPDGGRPNRFGEILADFSLRRAGLVLASALILVLLSFLGATWLKQNFFPPSDRNQLVVDLKLPEGSHLDHTNAVAVLLEQELLKRPEVAVVSAYVGRSAPHFYYNLSQIPWSPHFAQVVVTTKDKTLVEELARHIRQFGATQLPDVEVIPRKLEQGPPVANPVEVRLYGENLEDLSSAADLVLAQLRGIQGAVNIRHDLSLGSPRLRYTINDASAARFGLSRADVAISLYGKTRGLSVGQYRAGDDPVPVVLRARKGEDHSASELESSQVASANGASAPLGQVAVAHLEWRPAAINHRGRKRVVTVSAQLAEGYAFSDILAHLEPRVAGLNLPQGIRLEYGGQGEGSREANGSMVMALPLGVILLLGILLAEFNSFRRVGIVMVTVPLAAAGVVPGLLISGQPFGFMSMLGVIALIGVVVNNAIVLLDVIESCRKQGQALEQAVRTAVVRRTRPILLTTLTTVAGLMPLAFSGSNLWPPLAWSITSGLLASTFLTLLVVPSLYLTLFRSRRGRAGARTRQVATTLVGLFLYVLAPSGLRLSAGETVTLTLEEVMARAAQRPIAQAAEERAQAALAEAEAVRRAGLLPVLEGAGSLGTRDEASSIQTPAGVFELGERQSTTVDLRLALPLYDGVNRRGAKPASLAHAQAEQSRSGRTRQEVVFSAAHAFLELKAHDARLQSTATFIRSLRDRLVETEARVRLGRSLEIDALKVRLRLESAERDKLVLEEARGVASWRLGHAIGHHGPVEPAATEPVMPAIDTPEGALFDGLDARLDVDAARNELTAAEYQRKGIRAERLPKLEAVAAYSWAEGDAFREGTHWQTHLQLSWQPFASGTRKPRLAAASHRVRALQAQLMERRRVAELQVREARAQLATARHDLNLALSGVTLAQETLRVERERFREGRITTNDLLDAEAGLHRRQTDRDLARIHIIRTHLQLKLARGSL